MKIASKVEQAFVDLLANRLEGMTVMGYQSRTDEIEGYAVVIEAGPEEVWFRDNLGKAVGWHLPITAHVLSYVEDVKADPDAIVEMAGDVRDILYGLADEDIRAVIPSAYSISGYTQSEAAAERAEEGNYDRWAATMRLHLTEQEGAES